MSEANGVHVQAVSAKVPFAVLHLTPFAPGIPAATPLDDPSRWIQCWSPTPVQLVRKLLGRLERSADGVEARPMAFGDTAIIGKVGEFKVPLGFVGEEVPSAVVLAALEAVRQGVMQ